MLSVVNIVSATSIVAIVRVRFVFIVSISSGQSAVARLKVDRFPLIHGPKRCLYSMEVMKALTISALTKLPLNWFSFVSQKSKPE